VKLLFDENLSPRLPGLLAKEYPGSEQCPGSTCAPRTIGRSGNTLGSTDSRIPAATSRIFALSASSWPFGSRVLSTDASGFEGSTSAAERIAATWAFSRRKTEMVPNPASTLPTRRQMAAPRAREDVAGWPMGAHGTERAFSD